MHRAYAKQIPLDTDVIVIHDTQEIHHLKDVLRLKKGSRLCVFNGQGQEAEGEILSITKDRVEIARLSFRQTDVGEGRPRIILACAVPKHTKFEWIIEKAVELGVDEVVPLKTARTEFHVTRDRAMRKNERYHTVAVNAAKQSKRLTVPVIHPFTEFSQALGLVNSETCALIPCLLGDRTGLARAVAQGSAQRIIVFIGPEGDFTPEEVSAAIQAGAVAVSLGDTVLKVETAALSVLAFLTFLKK
jgi:16S rRNA (uracil1498-N3)-methyltransferase